ncbi:DUF2690 domain-containing protein [Nonomuraea sp. NPDC050383]|uniref:DUF2690 domain-containing protein n=1 Tax=Nonomuraea sp. NPDC050383 TaxID=3364362 RepID=UPI003790A408
MYRALAAVTLSAGLLLPASAVHAQDDPGSGRRDVRSGDVRRGCSGTRCDGLDPIDLGCDSDARTNYRLSTRLGVLERRYSPSCDASWARITGAGAGTWFYVQTCDGSYVRTFRVPPGYNHAYTDMVPGSRRTRVGDLAGHGPC